MTPQYDHVPPVTTLTVTDRWRRAPAQVWFQATDDRDGVAHTHWSVDGSAESTFTSPLVFNQSGVFSVGYRLVDNRGNGETTKTATVRVDAGRPEAHLPSVRRLQAVLRS